MHLLYRVLKMLITKEHLPLLMKIFDKICSFEIRADYRSFNKLYKRNHWSEAISVGQDICNLGLQDAELLHKMAICYFKLEQPVLANDYMERSMITRAKLTTNQILDLVYCNAFPKHSDVISGYAYLGGLSNVGFFKHEVQIQKAKFKYFTKVALIDSVNGIGKEREVFFHNVIREQFPKLKSISLELMSSFDIKPAKLSFMTFEKAVGVRATIHHLEKVIYLSDNIVGSIQYGDIAGLIESSGINAESPLFSLIHKKITHKFILSNAKRSIKKRHLGPELEDCIDILHQIIIKRKLYNKIDPNTDYVFCHGDFDPHNVIYNKKDKMCLVIDWANYGFGLKGYDLMNFFCWLNLPFQEIVDIYLDKTVDMDVKAIVREIFLVYFYIVNSISHLNKVNFQSNYTQCINPAIHYLESLSLKLES